MKTGSILIIVILFLTSCNQNKPNESHLLTYNHYRHFGIDKTLYDFEEIRYETVEYLNRTDTLFKLLITHDSLDLSKLGDFNTSVEFVIKFDNDSLINSVAYYPDPEPGEVYHLTMIKKQQIAGKQYIVYRFNDIKNEWSQPESLFFTREFGIVATFSYHRNSLFLLAGISDFQNKDYLKISEELINDSVFLFSYGYRL